MEEYTECAKVTRVSKRLEEIRKQIKTLTEEAISLVPDVESIYACMPAAMGTDGILSGI